MAYIQGQKVANMVVPLIRAVPVNDVHQYEELFGTGFLIGKRSFGLTCAHVIEQLEAGIGNKAIVTYLIQDNMAEMYRISQWEKHPTEDIAVFKVDDVQLKSVFTIQPTSENSAFDYEAFGYPMEIAKDAAREEEGAKPFPELIYTRGYIRRRIQGLLPYSIYRGDNFYELSAQGGSGYSGSPVLTRPKTLTDWPVIGVYLGEREGDKVSVGYALNSEAFYEWAPNLLGRSVCDECTQ